MAWAKVEDRNAWFRARYERNKKRLQDYKLERGCKDCGTKKHHAILELDHLPGVTKRDAVSALLGRGWNIVAAELEKCEVVCANCHAMREWQRRQKALSSSG